MLLQGSGTAGLLALAKVSGRESRGGSGFRGLEVARECNGPRIPNRPPSRLTEIRPRHQPGRPSAHPPPPGGHGTPPPDSFAIQKGRVHRPHHGTARQPSLAMVRAYTRRADAFANHAGEGLL
jgi:hypothetical protein